MQRLSISAIIPAYNSAQFLPFAINSILKQTVPVDEIIVVDDGSTDDTSQIVAKYGSQVQYVYQDNSGPSAARNRGIECARGNWIAFLDADDQWTTQKIEKQCRFISENKVVLVAGDMAEVDSALNILEPSVLQKHDFRSFFVKNCVLENPEGMEFLLKKNFIPTGTVLVEKKVLSSVGAFNTQIRFGEDLELWSKISGLYPIACLPEVLMFRTRHESNATSSTENMLKDLVRVMLSLEKWIDQTSLVPQFNINYYIARAWIDLGYFNFASNSLIGARDCFLKSMAAKPSARAALYIVASFVPGQVIDLIRSLKSAIEHIRGQDDYHSNLHI